MKRAVILHGTNGHPGENWFPWLKAQLEKSGYEVYVPLLPENSTPNFAVYEEFLRNSDWDFSDNLIIGHSSGATTALRLLARDWFPEVRATVLAGAFLNQRLLKANPPSWYDPSDFTHLFGEDYDIKTLQKKGGKFYFVHGDDDPYCDYGDAKDLNDQLGGTMVTVPDGGHLGAVELPRLADALRSDGLL